MPRVTLVGISGPSSSGKTTLSRLLRDILTSSGHKAFILHEDDFYISDKDIPIHAETQYQDWDCLEAIDASALEAALKHIKAHGSMPPEFASKEDQNSVGKVDVEDKLVEQLKNNSGQLTLPEDSIIAILDGFLLYTPKLENAYKLLDIRLFLPVTRNLMISRRSARSGYVTIEGFWEDPPGYVEKVVWPNYVEDHAYLFNNGDVEGEPKHDVVFSMKLDIAPRAAMTDMNQCLSWAWQSLVAHLSNS